MKLRLARKLHPLVVSSKRPVLLKDHYLLTISEKAKHTVLFNYLLTGSFFLNKSLLNNQYSFLVWVLNIQFLELCTGKLTANKGSVHTYPATKEQCNALSFYRSQNVLCQSNFFEPAQKFECI